MRVDLNLPSNLSGWVRRLQRDFSLHHPHSHDELECNLILKGTGIYWVDDSIFHLQAGDLLWLHPQQEHLLMGQSPDLEAWLVVIRPEALLTMAQGLPQGDRLLSPSIPADQICHRLPMRQWNACDRLLGDVNAQGADSPWMNAAMGWVLTRLWKATLDAHSQGTSP